MTAPGVNIVNGKYYCPICHSELRIEKVRYKEIENGVFKSDTTITETTYTCRECGWSSWTKES